MIETATIYVWQKNQPFNIDYVIFLLGGLSKCIDEEPNHLGNGMYCTEGFKIYSTTKKQHTETKSKYKGMESVYPHFRTAKLEERFSQLGLPIPDVEITFCNRGNYNIKSIDAEKVKAVAAHLSYYKGLEVLCVPGTSIEQDQYLASEPIASKLGIQAIPK